MLQSARLLLQQRKLHFLHGILCSISVEVLSREAFMRYDCVNALLVTENKFIYCRSQQLTMESGAGQEVVQRSSASVTWRCRNACGTTTARRSDLSAFPRRFDCSRILLWYFKISRTPCFKGAHF